MFLLFVTLYLCFVMVDLMSTIAIWSCDPVYFKRQTDNDLFICGSFFRAVLISFVPVLNFLYIFLVVKLLTNYTLVKQIIKGENKVNIIDKALSSKKEVEELEKQLINKKALRDAAKKIAKDDLEWILKEEN